MHTFSFYNRVKIKYFVVKAEPTATWQFVSQYDVYMYMYMYIPLTSSH